MVTRRALLGWVGMAPLFKPSKKPPRYYGRGYKGGY